MSRMLLALLLLAAGPHTALVAQPVASARMVVDLVKLPRPHYFPFLPGSSFQPVGDAFLFAHDDGVHGAELWRTDGTEAGTWMVKDVCPGACIGVGSWERQARSGLYYFPGNDGVHGLEPWVSDGTAEGTRMLADVVAGPDGTNPFWIEIVGDRVFWSGRHPDGGGAVWTLHGDTPVDVHRSEESHPAPMIAVGDKLFFVAGGELWSTDDTLTVVPLHHETLRPPFDFHPWHRAANPWVVHEGRLFFGGKTNDEGAEPWVSDGTPEGTFLLQDVLPGSDGSGPRFFVVVGDEVLFRAKETRFDDRIWATDGSPGEVRSVFDPEDLDLSRVGRILVSDGERALFQGTTPASGSEPWITDGTRAGTRQVADINPGSGHSLEWPRAFPVSELAAGGGLFFFGADDGVHGPEPWVTDGTEDGTRLLADIATRADWHDEEPGSMGWISGEVTWTGSEFLFVASEGLGGREPWASDGTPSGTRRIADLIDQSSSLLPCFYPPHPCSPFVGGDHGVFFSAGPEAPPEEPWNWGPRLHLSGGTAESTHEVPLREDDGTEIDVSLSPFETPAAAASRLVFTQGFEDDRVWATDGTEPGTVELLDLRGTAERPGAGPFIPLGGQVFFGANGDLWQTDGTSMGTLGLGVPAPPDRGLPRTLPSPFLTVDGTLFWGVGGSIWALEPGSAPFPSTDLPGDGGILFMGALPAEAGSTQPRLIFWYDDGATGREPWVADGDGVRRLRDIVAGESGSYVKYPRDAFTEDPGIYRLAASNDRYVFFVAQDDEAGATVWRTDGTPTGTVPLVRRVGEVPRWPRSLTRVGPRIFFAAELPGHGLELWASHGIRWSTRMLETVPGEASSFPRYLTAVDGGVLYSAFHPETGVELWYARGRPAFAQLFQDLHPGPGSSSPTSLTVALGRIWFAANDGSHGFEPWSLPLKNEIFSDDFETGDATAWSGR